MPPAANTIIVEDTAAKLSFEYRGMVWRIAWRNLWRSPRRTWLTAASIAFACLLVSVGMAMQAGSYKAMIETATGFYTGQAQINHQSFVEDERLEHTIPDATALMRALDRVSNLFAAPRAQGFALVSVGDRSFGGLVVGVDFDKEQQVVTFFNNLTSGTLPKGVDEVVIGETMARNLGAGVGSELVLLGAAKQGGVAALALTISGLFSSGQSELDRTLLFTHLEAVQNGFSLGDEIHTIAIRVADLTLLEKQISQLQTILPDDVIARSWRELMPQVTQGIELDRISAKLMYGAILILVSFSVINTFLMVVFERTREFGMLLAIGMRPGLIIRQVLAEALFVWGVGVAVGLLLVVLLVSYFSSAGISIEGMEELARQFYMPDRIYPAITLQSLVVAPGVLLVGTQIAAFVASWRIRNLQPVAALRVD